MAVNTVEQLDSLLLTLARFLKDNEISPDEWRNRYDALPSTEKQILGKLFKQHRKTKNKNRDSERDPSIEENSGNCKQAERENLRLFQVSTCEVQSPLHATLKSCKEKKSPGPFFEALSRQIPINRGIGATYSRIRQDEEKDALLQILRRFQLRELYLYAVRYCYHTGKSWRNNGIPALTKEINTQCPDLQDSVAKINKQLQLYVELGRGYDAWVAELGHPGYLFALSLEVSETEYTKRLYRKHIPDASRRFRDLGLDDVVSYWELGNLGEAVSQFLEESSQPPKPYESDRWNTKGDVSLKRRSEFTSSASKRLRFQSCDTRDEGHDTLPIPVNDGTVSNTDDSRSEQFSEPSSTSNATDPTEVGNLTEAIANIVQNQQTNITGERAISLSQKLCHPHSSRTQVTSPAPSHSSLFPDENVSSTDNHQQGGTGQSQNRSGHGEQNFAYNFEQFRAQYAPLPASAATQQIHGAMQQYGMQSIPDPTLEPELEPLSRSMPIQYNRLAMPNVSSTNPGGPPTGGRLSDNLPYVDMWAQPSSGEPNAGECLSDNLPYVDMWAQPSSGEPNAGECLSDSLPYSITQ
ncbi:hypothetical protein ACJ73_01910 [Blastomyces percursus]|uniref:Uncharacterized protein n=1 Tax=Blastomyces percursus TaxID=1658174 RepID=A0A1J9QCZ1_9EURO|nr:hypothetical protein ACJ73_01910 [Blastomyces percursus]